MAELVDDSVYWRPSTASDPIQGFGRVRAHLRDALGADGWMESTTHDIREVDGAVVARGGVRTFDGRCVRDAQRTWVYLFDDDGRLLSATSCATDAEALGVIAAA